MCVFVCVCKTLPGIWCSLILHVILSLSLVQFLAEKAVNGSSNYDYCQLFLQGSSKAESFPSHLEDRENAKRNESEIMQIEYFSINRV